MKRIAILISGQGSNLRAIVQASRAEAWPAQMVAVLSDRADAPGLAWASEQGLPTVLVDRRLHPHRMDFDLALSAALDALAPDLVVLAGFMRILAPELVERYAGRMLNVHPSLLPAFPGLRTHQRAIDAGCRIAGATVHFVTAELDHGPIVIQAAVPVQPDDDAQALAARVLIQEHQIFPRAVAWFVRDELQLAAGRVRHVGAAAQFSLGDGPTC
ncbi:MAG: phosphoribosylglycinamide formyltransferase [Leptothrix sp. (in: b-proteobacteria)]